ncbi:MAG: xanthine dehydrogenase family protein subunit M [Haliangiales bacterium]
MYPPPFEYVAPETLDDALALLTEHGDEAKILAGGQSLIPLLKLRFAAPTILIDIGRVPGLRDITVADGVLRVGALVRHATLASDPKVAAHAPLIASAGPQVADPLVRNLGTVGGSLAHADPAGDWGAVMLALGAEIVMRGPSGARTVPIADFFQGLLTTALAPDEILCEVRVPVPTGKHGGVYLKLERKVGDFATVAAALQVELDDAGQTIRRAGVALTAVGPQNLLVRAAEDALKGQPAEPAQFAKAAALAADHAEPDSDVRGSAEYKREIVRVFVERGLAQACEVARARK